MTATMTWVGLDVHARSTHGAAIDRESGELSRARFGGGVEPVVVWLAVHQLLAEPSLGRLIIAQMATSLVMAFLWGPTPVMLMELLPVGVRSTGVGLIYNVAVALFGGLAPFIVTWLISVTGDKASPAYYVAFSAMVGVFGLLLMRERPR